MNSLTNQWSKVVLLALFFAKSLTTSNSSNVAGTVNDDKLIQLANIFRELNTNFDLKMVRRDQPEESSQLDHANLTNDKTTSKDDNIHIQDRSDSHTPWYCHSVVEWKDLGNLHYPRFVKEIRCSGNTCMHGFYNCRPGHYPLRVLSAREETDRISPNIENSFLPPGLRQNWTMMEIDIAVDCTCGN